ncbi:MAG: AI-2E family transporter [Planctomycetota bacterium]|nr:AI-2E family transporter [Planctomycetota bacterium]
MDNQRGSILPANMSPVRRNLLLALVGALFLWFVWSIRAVVNPLLLGYLAAYILHPMVLRLEHRGMSRRKAVNVIFLAGIVGSLLVGAGVLLQGKGLVENVVGDQDIQRQISDALDSSISRIEEMTGQDIKLPRLDLSELYQQFQAAVMDGQAGVPEAAGDAALAKSEVGGVKQFSGRLAVGLWARVKGLFGSVIGIGGMLLLVPLYAYYMLFHLGGMHASVRRYLPKRDRESLSNIGRQIGQMLAAFFRGRLLVCLVKGLLISIGLMIVGVDYAFLFGMVSGGLSLIPMVGPFFGYLVTALLSIPSFKIEDAVSGGPQFAVLNCFLICAVVFTIAELIEGYVLMPKILGDSLRMNEVEVLFYLLAGGASLGMLGVLLALPIAAVIKILLKEVVLPALERFADDPSA